MKFDDSIEVPTDQELQHWTLELPAKAGVYLLWGADHKPILLATSGSVRSAVRRKLTQDQTDIANRRAKLWEITKGVSWTQSNSNFVAYVQFHEFARELYPKSYRKMLGFSDAWWVKVSLSEQFGRLLPTKRLDVTEDDEYLGPFANAKAARSFIDLATDMYGLCRDYEILQQVSANKRTKACAYAQMQKCCRVCLGTVSASEYRQRLFKAVALADAKGRLAQQEQLAEQMNQAATRLEFEEAANGKKLLKRLAHLASGDFRWLGNLRDCEFLVVASGASTKEIWPWKVRQGSIEAGKAIKLAQIEKELPKIVKWSRQTIAQVPVNRGDIQRWREKIALVSYFLFRSHNDKCLYYKLDNLPEESDLAKQITERFSKTKANKSVQNPDLKTPAEQQ